MYKKNQIGAWSFSRYADYEQCPLKAKLKYLDRIQEPPNQAMNRGIEIHKTVESFINGTLKRLPKELKALEKELIEARDQFKRRSQRVYVEHTWAFTKDWDITRWDDWTNCWLRVKIDWAFVNECTGAMVIQDWKTGKFREDQKQVYIEQLELYALSALLTNPDLELVIPRLGYLDLGIVWPEPGSIEEMLFDRGDLDVLKKTWMNRTKRMLKDKSFVATPNDKCRWCFYRADNASQNGGGLCKF